MGNSNLQNNQRKGTGGDGGKIFIITNKIKGAGKIIADGGDGSIGGKGGEVQIVANKNEYSGSVSAKGGKPESQNRFNSSVVKGIIMVIAAVIAGLILYYVFGIGETSGSKIIQDNSGSGDNVAGDKYVNDSPALPYLSIRGANFLIRPEDDLPIIRIEIQNTGDVRAKYSTRLIASSLGIDQHSNEEVIAPGEAHPRDLFNDKGVKPEEPLSFVYQISYSAPDDSSVSPYCVEYVFYYLGNSNPRIRVEVSDCKPY